MALSADANIRTRVRDIQFYKLKNGVTVYKNSLIVVDASTGYADKAADSANLVFKGLAIEGAVGDTSASEVPTVGVDESGVVMGSVTVTGASAITDQNKKVYIASDDPNALTLTPTTNMRAVGRIARWISGTTCDVKLFEPEEYASQLVAADVTLLTDNGGGASADGTIGAVTAPTALTHAVGTADGTVDDVGSSFSQTILNNNFKELTTAQAANRLAIIALTDAIKELSTKQNELLTALNLQQ